MSIGSVIGDVAEKAFKDLAESSIGQWLKPAMREMEATPSGGLAADILKNKFEPEVAKATAFNRAKLGYSPRAAVQAAVSDTGDKYFGKRGEGIVNILKAVHKESGGNKVHVNNVADALDMYFGERGLEYPNWRQMANKEKLGIRPSSRYQAPGPIERASREVASWIFLPRIVIPHATQPLNVLLYNGAAAFGKAADEMFSGGLDAAKRRVLMSGVLEDTIMQQMKETAKGGGIARKLFHMPGFNYMREMQVTHAALAGEFSVRDAFDEYLLEGRNLNPKTELTFRRHGIDPANLKDLKELTPEMVQTAQYRAAQSTYFMRSGLDVPYPWQQDWKSRMFTLYKNFAYNQGRFLVNAVTDSFKASPEEGLKTIAIIGTLFPMAGYAVGQVEDAITQRKPPTNEKERSEFYSQYIDAVGHAAGFGVGYSMFRAAKRNKLADYAIGPVPSTIIDYTQDIVNAGTPAGKRRLGRDVMRRIPLVGPAMSEHFLPRQKRGRKPRISY